jgi:hypothetical protein
MIAAIAVVKSVAMAMAMIVAIAMILACVDLLCCQATCRSTEGGTLMRSNSNRHPSA